MLRAEYDFKSYATGDVNVTEPENSALNFFGGLVGTSWNTEFENTYATGDIMDQKTLVADRQFWWNDQQSV